MSKKAFDVYEYIREEKEKEMYENKMYFYVQGSGKKPYKLTFWKNDNDFKSSCNCPAGKNGSYCKHRLELLTGEVTNLLDGIEKLPELTAMLKGTDVDEILEDFSYYKQCEVIYKNLGTLYRKVTRQEIHEEEMEFDENKVKEILELGFFIKHGKNCYLFKDLDNYVGYFYRDKRWIDKVLPDILVYENYSLYTFNENLVDYLNNYSRDKIATLKYQMKEAIR